MKRFPKLSLKFHSLTHVPLRPLLVAVFAFAWVAGLWAREDEGQAFMVGVPNDHFPISFYDKNNEPAGLAVELLQAIAQRENLRLTYVGGKTEEITARFLRGEFDLMVNFTPGVGYAGTGFYSMPYLKQEAVLLTSKAKGFTRVGELKGKNFAVLTFSRNGERFLHDVGLNPAEVIECGTIEEVLKLIADGEVDAGFASAELLAVYGLERGVQGIVQTGPPIVGYDFRFCYGVGAGKNQLQEQINRSLTDVRQSGDYAVLHHRWVGYASAPLLSREQILILLVLVLVVLGALAGVFVWQQRAWSRRIEAQARELSDSQAIIERAQQLSRVGHFRYDSGTHRLECSDETLAVIERRRDEGSPSYHKLMSLVVEADRPQMHRAARKVLTTGGSGEVTCRMEPQPGVVKTVRLSLQSQVDARGAICGMLGALQDITAQRATEAELRAHEQLLKALYDHVPAAMGVVEVKPEGVRIVSGNRVSAEMFGLSAEVKIAGRLLADLGLPKEAREFWNLYLRKGYDQAGRLSVEQRLGEQYFAITLVPLDGAQGPRRCYFVEDVTARHEADAEVAQGRRQRALGELVCGIAHEFNNLLTPILLKTEALSHELSGNAVALGELKTISRASKRGAELTKRLLAVGGPGDPNPEWVRLHALVSATFDLLRSSIDRRVGLALEVSEQLPPLYVNQTDLRQALVHVILNARDTLMQKLETGAGASWQPKIQVEAQCFAPEKVDRRIVSGGEERSGWVSLCVRDNGMGIAAERLENLFVPALKGEGTQAHIPGLGLATASLLLSRMGGKITVQSVLGEGSTFNLWLPLRKTPEVALAASPVEVALTTAPIGVRKEIARVLFVEDDEMVAQTIITALRRQKHTVMHFNNGADGWRYLSVHPHDFDLLLLDMDLPGINGLEIARRARGSRYQGKIIVTSGRLPEVGSKALTELKVDAQIEKPFTPQALHQAIVSALNAG